jgi:hypothetical protein
MVGKMNNSGAQAVSRRVLLYEAVAFLAIIAFIWLDELIDLPRLVSGAEATPVNWREAMLESAAVAVVGAVILHFTGRMFARMRYLEGILPVCASCKKIRDKNNTWQEIEVYIRDRTDADFSHSICPECAARLYPDLDLGELHRR